MTDVLAFGRLFARELSEAKRHSKAVRGTPSAETRAAPMYRHILIATDGSALADKAVTSRGWAGRWTWLLGQACDRSNAAYCEGQT